MFSFIGPNKIISIDTGVTSFKAVDLYSRWKEWVKESDNAKYAPAFAQSVGGDDLGGGIFLGSYFFLQNNWKIRPMEQDHVLTVEGNLFNVPSSESAFTQTVGNYNVQILQERSSLTQAIATGQSTTIINEATKMNPFSIKIKVKKPSLKLRINESEIKTKIKTKQITVRIKDEE